MTRALITAALAALAALAAGAAAAQTFEAGVQRHGATYGRFDAEAPDVCQTVCDRDARCRAWTFVQPGLLGPSGQCEIKAAVTPAVASPCCVSGLRGTLGLVAAPSPAPEVQTVASPVAGAPAREAPLLLQAAPAPPPPTARSPMVLFSEPPPRTPQTQGTIQARAPAGAAPPAAQPPSSTFSSGALTRRTPPTRRPPPSLLGGGR